MKPAERVFYVYVYSDPVTGTPFYVGKGTGERFKKHLNPKSSNEKMRQEINRIIDAGGRPSIVVHQLPCEADALALERSLIAIYGRKDRGTGPLLNRTSGGQGAAGRVGFRHSDETKRRIRQSLTGRVITPEHRAKIGSANRGRPGASAETQRKAADARRTPEVRAKFSAAAKRTVTPERLAHLTELAAHATRGKTKTPEHRAKIAAAQKGRVFSAETRAAMSAAQRRRYAK